jgi:hypothetical protein
VDNKIEALLEIWKKRNIEGFYCGNRCGGAAKVLEIIPVSASVGICGSVTMDQLGLIGLLEERHQKIFNQYQPGLSRQESQEKRVQGAGADYYIASANAISQDGKMVFFSAYGNRTAGIAGAKNVVVVCGINKVTPTLDDAMRRSRDHVTPLNCKRLNWPSPCLKQGACHEEECFFPEYKRMCCQILIIEAEAVLGRLKVVLIGETLGY